MRLRSERIVTPGGTLAGEVCVRDGVIESLSPGASSADAIDLGSDWLVPGFIDLHVHGGGGAQFNTRDVDEVLAVARFHAAHGTTSLLATTVCVSVDELVGALQAIAGARGAGGGAVVLGAHLEGPFLSPSRPGAMDPGLFLRVDEAVADQLLAAGGGGCVRMMTLAPELPGARTLISTLVSRGVVCSLGHSEASVREAQAAVASGARSATHVFNAMPPLHHRAPGLVGAVLDLDEVSCELICDGIHVDPVVMRLVQRAKGLGGLHLVTDAMAAAGMPDGSYRLGATRVRVSEGRAVLEGGESLAGSTLTMGDAVANAVKLLGLTVHEAVRAASRNPARLLGVSRHKGAIGAEMDADLVVLDEHLGVRGTMIGGQWVHGPQ